MVLKKKYNIYLKPTLPIKQKHSPAGHSYNKICGRNCYMINRLQQWTYCECIKKERQKTLKKFT
jgi:hypothetical protein